jgi:hypothetical protein
MQKIPTVVLDPYLLMSMSAMIPSGALAACLYARFAICDHIPPEDFLPEEYEQLVQALNRENIEMLSVPAVELADLLPMRNVLVLNQIATIAAARCHGCMFTSDCCVFRRAATTVLKPALEYERTQKQR